MINHESYFIWTFGLFEAAIHSTKNTQAIHHKITSWKVEYSKTVGCNWCRAQFFVITHLPYGGKSSRNARHQKQPSWNRRIKHDFGIKKWNLTSTTSTTITLQQWPTWKLMELGNKLFESHGSKKQSQQKIKSWKRTNRLLKMSGLILCHLPPTVWGWIKQKRPASTANHCESK
jgi:hypothetical protein